MLNLLYFSSNNLQITSFTSEFFGDFFLQIEGIDLS